MRRGNGDGSIFKLSGKRRKPYAVRVTVGWTEEGKQIYKYVGYYAKLPEAKTALREFLLNPQKMKLEKHTLKEVFNSMIEKSKFTDGTRKQYEGGFKKFPHLHNRNIADIELWELEELLKDQTPAVQARIKKTLHNCYKYALKHDYVNKNIAEFLEVDSFKPKERDVFKLDEIRTLWENVNSKPFDDIPLMLLYTGLRISELLELKKEHINLTEKSLNIIKSKTEAGVRIVPIHDKILPLIQNRMTEPGNHLIMNNGRKMAYSTFLREYWNLAYKPHEARHTFVTYLTKCSDDRLAIKRIVGHSNSDITDHYTHRSHDELLAVINKLKYE